MKYEAMTQARGDKTYGVWNHDMKAFQHVYEWNGTEVIDLEEANRMAFILNECASSSDTHEITTYGLPKTAMSTDLKINKFEAQSFLARLETNIAGARSCGNESAAKWLEMVQEDARALLNHPSTGDK